MKSLTEHGLIEDVDEAEANLRQYRRLCRNLSATIVGSVAMLLVGSPWAAVSWAGWWTTCLGFGFAVAAVICLIVCVSTAYEKNGVRHPAKLARAARRRHRDYLAKGE